MLELWQAHSFKDCQESSLSFRTEHFILNTHRTGNGTQVIQPKTEPATVMNSTPGHAGKCHGCQPPASYNMLRVYLVGFSKMGYWVTQKLDTTYVGPPLTRCQQQHWNTLVRNCLMTLIFNGRSRCDLHFTIRQISTNTLSFLCS